MYIKSYSVRGAGLLEVVVASALLVVVFTGFMGALQLGTKLATSNKAYTGATALALERMEYVRSLAYADVGVVGGTPSGVLEGSEDISFNNVSYTRTTVVVYVDDSADGSGGADSNGRVHDYKKVKVAVAWTGPNGVRTTQIVSNVVSPVIE